MEDRPLATHSLPQPGADVYRCPGESYAIDRAVHLGRLASFYPGCRRCAHRHETHTLSPLEIGHWAEIGRRGAVGPRFMAESLRAKSPHEMQGSVVRQFAAALGIALWRDRDGRPKPPAVLVGADGHWITAELVAAVCGALQWAGCRATEIGAVTSAALAAAGHRFHADAAVWIGNASGEPHAIDLKVWGPAGKPWSSPGNLEIVREIYQSKVDRPKRRGGGLNRAHVDELYLAPFHSLFHALRPLKLVVDTTCEPLVRYLDKLVSQAACEVLRPGQSVGSNAAGDTAKSFLERRLATVGQQVLAAGADFGLWVDGDAEACHLVDERGASVDCQRLLLLLAQTVCRQQPDATLVLEREAQAEFDAALASLGARAIRSDSTRQAMCEAMHGSGAVFGGGPSGRFCFSGSPAAPDVLLTISLLLTILSESDRTLSDVLDAA
ncbi:MAG: hypothetical protein HY288_19150 [Planctomycetia bacterium]|nr:hypothetical protein [Planctomycetia bacterium]